MSNVTRFPERSGNGSDNGGSMLEARVERLEADVREIRDDMKAVKSDVASIKEGLAEIKGQLKAMPNTVQLLGFIVAVLVASGLLKHFG